MNSNGGVVGLWRRTRSVLANRRSRRLRPQVDTPESAATTRARLESETFGRQSGIG